MGDTRVVPAPGTVIYRTADDGAILTADDGALLTVTARAAHDTRVVLQSGGETRVVYAP